MSSFIEGDAEALPYPDASFDVVLSQFGHMFAPRPAVAVKEMLRVLKTGGRDRVFDLAAGAFHRAQCSRSSRAIYRRRRRAPSRRRRRPCGATRTSFASGSAAVKDLKFARDTLVAPALSLQHFRAAQERTIGPLTKIIASLQNDPAKLAQLRAEYEAMIAKSLRTTPSIMHFLMTRATKA